MEIFAVIMAGGSGERLWPLSTPLRPKQFVTLFGGKPLIRHALDRLAGLVPVENVLVVTAKTLVGATREALPSLPKANVLAEPCLRNTAPAIALACAEVRRRGGGDAVVAVLTADHLIGPDRAFRATLKKAARLAAVSDSVVTIGIRPTFPSTGFGYIDAASEPPSFVEKPDAKTARRFLKRGTYLWNSGMFIFREGVMERALRAFAPDVARLLDARRPLALYPSIKAISIDYAVMEKLRGLKVVPASFHWDDVGAWDSVADKLGVDRDGNAFRGEVAALDTTGSLVVSEPGTVTAVMGLKDVVVVNTGKVTLVMDRRSAQGVKKLVALASGLDSARR